MGQQMRSLQIEGCTAQTFHQVFTYLFFQVRPSVFRKKVQPCSPSCEVTVKWLSPFSQTKTWLRFELKIKCAKVEVTDCLLICRGGIMYAFWGREGFHKPSARVCGATSSPRTTAQKSYFNLSLFLSPHCRLRRT